MSKLLRIPDVLKRTGLKRSTFYGLRYSGKFPAPILLADRCVAWPEEQIDQWLATRSLSTIGYDPSAA